MFYWSFTSLVHIWPPAIFNPGYDDGSFTAKIETIPRLNAWWTTEPADSQRNVKYCEYFCRRMPVKRSLSSILIWFCGFQDCRRLFRIAVNYHNVVFSFLLPANTAAKNKIIFWRYTARDFRWFLKVIGCQKGIALGLTILRIRAISFTWRRIHCVVGDYSYGF